LTCSTENYEVYILDNQL